jgi:hypothetical protein
VIPVVDVTPAAQAVLDEALPAVQQVPREVMKHMSVERQELLLELLADVRRGISELPAELPPPAPRRRPARLER